MPEELRMFTQKRGFIKSQLTRLRNHFNTCTGLKDVSQLRLRLNKFEQTWQEFNYIQSEIELIDPSTAQEQERESFENAYFQLTTEIFDFIEKHVNAVSRTPVSDDSPADQVSQQSSPQTGFKFNDIKLPTINLPKFNGQYEEWVTFYDTFKSLIHENNNLASIQKFHYLKSSLTGEAITIIQSIELTANNYTVAWNLLKDRYENEKLIIKTHVKNIFDLPSVFKESSNELRQFTDGLMKNIRALEALGQQTKTWDPLLNHIIFLKLDPITQREFENNTADRKLPTLDEIIAFLNQRCRILEAIETARVQNKNTSNVIKYTKTVHVSTNNGSCKICGKAHPIYTCDDFIKLLPAKRVQEVKRLKLCLNCLKSGHFSSECSLSYCRKCSKPHNTLLHLETQTMNATKPTTTNEDQQSTTISTHCATNTTKQVILSTALVLIADNKGVDHQCRALLDTGSQSNFMTSEISQILKLKTQPTNSPVSGIGQNITNIRRQTKATIKSRINNYNENLNFLIIPKITDNIPGVKLNISHLDIPRNIILADHTYHEPGKIDLLIGADTFYNLLCIGQIKLARDQPILQKTKLGWIISGNINYQNPTNFMCHLNINIENQLKKFWEIEEPIIVDKNSFYSQEEMECEELFKATTTRDDSGRFTVHLPFQNNVDQLGQSEEIARSRLFSLERKLNMNPELRNQYNQFMSEYEKLGHMSEISQHEIENAPQVYLPHHAVFKDDSTTTKTRVVFDGSAKTTSGVSLNDTLKIGPTIQDTLFDIVIRFRSHTYVLTADVAKMYRQINIVQQHRDYQRILWRYDSCKPIKHYRLNTVTYGTSAAPFLAIRSLKQLCIEEANNYPVAAEVGARDLYVDDLLTGANSIEKIKSIHKQLVSMFHAGNMQLRKWSTNNLQLKAELFGNDNDNTMEFGQNEGKKTLGLIWNPKSDNLMYAVKNINTNLTTKRTILSAIATIYDPLGLVGPVTIKAKILLQDLWQLKLEWDESVPVNLFTEWSNIRSELFNLNKLRIPRHVTCDKYNLIQLHVFSDASESAYGACVYIRASDTNQCNFSTLLCAKARVAPLKNITLPRLELCGAVLGVKLAQRVKSALTINFNKTVFWTDSSIVLAWIATPPNRLKTFVANRISEIQQSTNDAHWRHVRSNYNPADIISRGMYADNLINNTLWWNGPEWLNSNEDRWPESCASSHQQNYSTVPELKQTLLATNNTQHLSNIFMKYSSFAKLTRIIAYCYRFCNNAKSKNKQFGCLTVQEISKSKIAILKGLQQSSFKNELAELTRGNLVSKGSKLISLNPFLDNDKIIRVGGRLSNAQNISNDQKHPVVLPSDHIITINILREEHIMQLHCGPQALLAAVRLKYWPLRGKYLARKITHECVTCFKYKPKPVEYVMGDLPTSRIDGHNRPFTASGVDYCGPFQIKQSNTRGRPKLTKAYVAIFVCFATKAVHLELVSDLTSEAFIAALRRFIARRGLPSDLHSDNGTNFVGANRQLSELHDFLSTQDTKIKNELMKHNIKWHFNPPRSPHFGGLWEAAVKSFKTHFNKINKNIILTFEEMNTLIIQIEACLNSRPLTPLTSDPNDLYVLTPSHFLIGDSLLAINEADSRNTATNLLSRWQHLQKMKQHFWQRWHREYLHQLQQRTKWSSGSNQLKVGSLVMLIDDNLPPQRWICGRVTELHTGSDGVIRVVQVKTASGIYSRSARRVCQLPLSESVC